MNEAEKLAELLRTRNGNPSGFGLGPVCDEAASLIERQAEQIKVLRGATRDLVDCYCEIGNPMSKNDRMRHMLALNKARVLAATKEET